MHVSSWIVSLFVFRFCLLLEREESCVSQIICLCNCNRWILLLADTNLHLHHSLSFTVDNEQYYNSHIEKKVKAKHFRTWRSRSKWGQTLKIKHSEKQIFTMLLLVTFTYLILSFSMRALNFYLYFHTGNTPSYYAGFHLIYQIGFDTIYTNHAINFFLYVLSGRKFKTDCDKSAYSKKIKQEWNYNLVKWQLRLPYVLKAALLSSIQWYVIATINTLVNVYMPLKPPKRDLDWQNCKEDLHNIYLAYLARFFWQCAVKIWQ